MTWRVGASLLATTLLAAPASADGTVIARAVLPADTFAPGPTSGSKLAPRIHGRAPPFVDKQPVQGISAILDEGDGTITALVDNGFGNRANSPDARLRMYRLRPRLETADGGEGRIDVMSYVELSDPQHKVPYVISEQATPERFLTGADFDPESLQRARDGSFWLGDELGPYLLHVSAEGVLLEPPYSLPDAERGGTIRSPNNPERTERSPPARAQSSGGFEAMGIDLVRERLYPMIEHPLAGDPARTLWIYEFDLRARRYTGRRYRYVLDERATSTTDFTLYGDGRGLVIERDESEGKLDGFKRVFDVRLPATGKDVEKRPLLDLLKLDNPARLGGAGVPGDVGLGDPLAMPFVTIESLAVVSPWHVVIVNDNNYPMSMGRHVGSGQPDDTELVVVRLPRPLRGVRLRVGPHAAFTYYLSR